MVMKRAHQDSATVHPSRQAQVPGNSSRPTKKPRRLEPPEYKKQVHASSVNTIKKRIRDVTRRLERSQNLPANVRVEDERALATYQLELVEAAEEKIRQKMIKKYHMVRFFERQKASRQLKKLRKRLLEAQTPQEVEILKAQIHVAEVDLNYAQYYPLSEPYVSLYPQKVLGVTDESDSRITRDARTQKPSMWAEVEKRMTEGTLDQLRNRVRKSSHRQKDALISQPTRSKAEVVMAESSIVSKVKGDTHKQRARNDSMKKHSTKSSKDQRQEHRIPFPFKGLSNADSTDNDSDGGFFEE